MARERKDGRTDGFPRGGRETLDRESDHPAYAQLARILRDKIGRGIYRPGERIPSVPDLSAAFGVASMTVRQALDQLGREGLIAREQGRGTFVKAPHLGAAVFDLSDLRRQLTDSANEVRVLSARALRATARVASKLSVREGVRVISIRRLLIRDEAPIFYHSEYLVWDPRRPLVEAELDVTSLLGLFSGVGNMDIKNGELTLRASALRESEALQLGEETGALSWIVEHLFYDFADKPVSWGRFVCREDRLTFRATIGVSDEKRPSTRRGR